jgi:hypothetical protein
MTLRDDLNYGLAAFGVQIPERIDLDAWASSLAEKPFQNTSALVAVSSVLFFMAERGHNPKVNTIYDAMIYCSTCLNVGYADIFAKTPIGKIIGTFLMTIGPSMATKTTDGAPDRSQQQILELLRQIAASLPQQDAAPASGS